MFEPTSRYAELETATLTVTDTAGAPRLVTYVRRRFVPPRAPDVVPVQHALVQGERLDLLAARYFGDPTQFWRLCDANLALRPDELEQVPAPAIDIPLAGGL
jgi:hypothetical protein